MARVRRPQATYSTDISGLGKLSRLTEGDPRITRDDWLKLAEAIHTIVGILARVRPDITIRRVGNA
jgi:hypothetical protein